MYGYIESKKEGGCHRLNQGPGIGHCPTAGGSWLRRISWGRNEEELKAVAAQLDKNNAGTHAAYATADLSSKTAVMQYAEAVHQWSAHLDVLVNNAGIYLPGM